jgi:hypothetical protein
MAHTGVDNHVHDYSIRTPLGITDELRNKGILDVQIRECECGCQQLFVRNNEGEWEHLKKNNPISKLIYLG